MLKQEEIAALMRGVAPVIQERYAVLEKRLDDLYGQVEQAGVDLSVFAKALVGHLERPELADG